MTVLPHPTALPSDPAETTLASLASASFAPAVHAYAEACATVADEDDAEGIHDLRVACRRIRAMLALFDGCYPDGGDLDDRLRWLTQTLGPIRDLDVQLAGLKAWRREIPQRDRSGVDTALSTLRDRHVLERETILPIVRGSRVAELGSSLARCVSEGPTGGRDVRAVDVLPSRIRKRYRRVRKSGDGIDTSTPAADFHRLRIACKRLRYELEPIEVLYPAAEPLERELTALQDLLGQQHDAVVWIETLEALIGDPALHISGSAAFSLGRIAEHARDESERRLQESFRKRYRKVRGRRWNDLDAQMDAIGRNRGRSRSG